MRPAAAAVARILARQYSIVTWGQARAAGYSPKQIARMTASGRWLRLHRRVYRPSDAPASPDGDLLAACLATGGRASHESAGCLWGLLDRPPRVPTVSVPRRSRNERCGIVIHRSGRLFPDRPGTLRGIPCTDPLRTVIDLGSALSSAEIDDVVDRALAKGYFTVDALAAELAQPSSRHRRGVGVVRGSLERRGYLGAPSPSVLESKLLRLLRRAGVEPEACEQEVTWVGGRYRLDAVLAEGLAVEVDGYAYHSAPDQLRHDHRRHNGLVARLAGAALLVVGRGPRRGSRRPGGAGGAGGHQVAVRGAAASRSR